MTNYVRSMSDRSRLRNYYPCNTFTSSYPLKPYLLTPFLEPQGPSQEAYNRALKATRCSVERAFGVLKKRFRLSCLHLKKSVIFQSYIATRVRQDLVYKIILIKIPCYLQMSWFKWWRNYVPSREGWEDYHSLRSSPQHMHKQQYSNKEGSRLGRQS